MLKIRKGWKCGSAFQFAGAIMYVFLCKLLYRWRGSRETIEKVEKEISEKMKHEGERTKSDLLFSFLCTLIKHL